jgi:hypothetical protein
MQHKFKNDQTWRQKDFWPQSKTSDPRKERFLSVNSSFEHQEDTKQQDDIDL